jgi:hypothetical protein
MVVVTFGMVVVTGSVVGTVGSVVDTGSVVEIGGSVVEIVTCGTAERTRDSHRRQETEEKGQLRAWPHASRTIAYPDPGHRNPWTLARGAGAAFWPRSGHGST